MLPIHQEIQDEHTYVMSVSHHMNRDYTVGWVCALPTEMSTAKAMLDEYHGMPQYQHKSDNNSYYLDRISGHNDVLASLPAGVYGTTSAAVVATQIQSSFESIRFGLMVGIGGGIPSERFDTRLGDVVVSKPENSYGGFVQYDMVKTVGNGGLKRTGSLNKPPQVLTALANLMAEHEMADNKISQYVGSALDKHEKMKESYDYQGASEDRLYQAEYHHVDENQTCESCDNEKIIYRPDRGGYKPSINYGIIASSNQVIKDGRTRDRLKDELGAICFEMEAAGLMDIFPCLVVRGICDYADSHKNKSWQRHAAISAAAFAKELLGFVSPGQVSNTCTAIEAMKDQMAETNKAIRDVEAKALSM